MGWSSGGSGGGGSGSVATDTIWDAAGDLAVGSGADTAAKLTKGGNGTVLTVTAGAVGWAASASGADRLGLTPTAVKTAAYTAVAGDYVLCDSTSGGFTVTLPNAPADGSVIGVKHVIQGSTNVVTVVTHSDAGAAGGATGTDVLNKAGGVTSLTLKILDDSRILQYVSATAVWVVMTDSHALSMLDLRFAPITGIPESAVTNLTTDLAAKAPLANATMTGTLALAGATVTGLTAAEIPSLDAAKVTTGVLAVARLATGTPDGTKFVRDDGTFQTPVAATDPLLRVLIRQQYK